METIWGGGPGAISDDFNAIGRYIDALCCLTARRIEVARMSIVCRVRPLGFRGYDGRDRPQ